MKKQMHLAAQYLAAAGISFLEKEEDDSHTNLGFNTESKTLSTHPLSKNGDRLSLNYQNFSLDWNASNSSESLSLDGTSHKQIIEWIAGISKKRLQKKYVYKLHYDLPYNITDDFIFKLHDLSELQKLLSFRTVAQFSLKRIVTKNFSAPSIRVWPHHFDTGIYAKILDSEIFIGCGLAIPDTICKEYYLYINGYKDGQIMNTSSFDTLNIGEWKNNDFKGAVLSAKNLKETEAVLFFQEAINGYKK